MDYKRFEDRAEVIYVSAGYQDDSALGRLMHDMFCENPDRRAGESVSHFADGKKKETANK